MSEATRASTEGAPADAGPGKAGFPVVLSADRTLMAAQRTLFDGMLCGSQTTRTPSLLVRWLLAPRVTQRGCRASAAPLGLRRLEAAVATAGWDVAVVPPERLPAAIGPATRIIGLSCGDPLGLGMSSTTMTAIVGGRTHASRALQRLTRRVARLRKAAPDSRLVVGGPGAWQLAADDDARRRLVIDHVVTGYCEGNVGQLFDAVCNGRDTPTVLPGEGVGAETIPPILGPALMGSSEISRGCGLGCEFCALARTPMVHLPHRTILADVETNLAGGAGTITLVTEDIFRYGAGGSRVRPRAVLDLLQAIRTRAGDRLIQADHANVLSASAFSDGQLADVARLLAGREGRDDYVWLNLGVETAAGKLLAANGGRGKMGSIDPGEWGAFCREQTLRLCRAGFFPLVSLVLGLPGESADDLAATLAWVENLRDERLAVFPVLRAPMDGGAPFGRHEMSKLHWRIMRESYRLSFRWLTRLIWNNQSRGGVALWRRLTLQMLGRMQMVWWRTLFAWRLWRAQP